MVDAAKSSVTHVHPSKQMQFTEASSLRLMVVTQVVRGEGPPPGFVPPRRGPMQFGTRAGFVPGIGRGMPGMEESSDEEDDDDDGGDGDDDELIADSSMDVDQRGTSPS